MIRVTCPACQSKLDAKDELAGQTRKCPKCGTPVAIPPDMPSGLRSVEEPVPSLVQVDQSAGLRTYRPPERLSRLDHYLICDRSRVIATWQNDGRGWLVRGEFGFASAHRNQDKLPSQGDFKLVELQMRMEGERLRLHGLRVYQLAQRWALVNLARGDDAILKAVTGPGFLFREQKHAVRQQIKEQFMQHVWEDSRAVLEYLANSDYHSPGPPEALSPPAEQ
jgi:hypothetical protein